MTLSTLTSIVCLVCALLLYPLPTHPTQNYPPTAVLPLDEGNFDSVAYDEATNVVVLVHSPWCQACKALEPKLRRLVEHYSSQPDVLFTSVDASDLNLQGIDITVVPTLVLFPAGVGDKLVVDLGHPLYGLTTDDPAELLVHAIDTFCIHAGEEEFPRGRVLQSAPLPVGGWDRVGPVRALVGDNFHDAVFGRGGKPYTAVLFYSDEPDARTNPFVRFHPMVIVH